MRRIAAYFRDISNRDVMLILVGIALGSSAVSFAIETGIGSSWLEGFLQNFGTEMFGAFLTFLLIEVLAGGREKREEELRHSRQERERLAREMGSRDSTIALRGLAALASSGALHNGQLAGADLNGAALSGADLHGADLREADLSEADLSGADLRGANLESADLRRANLSGADLSEARLGSTALIRADLSNANLAGANMFAARAFAADLRGAALVGADLTEARFSEADLRGANLRQARMKGVNFVRANLDGAREVRDDQLAEVEGCWLATMPSGERYDGRFALYGDLDAARDRKAKDDPQSGGSINLDDAAEMAAIYQVSEEEYLRGQAWAREYAVRSRVTREKNNGETDA